MAAALAAFEAEGALADGFTAGFAGGGHAGGGLMAGFAGGGGVGPPSSLPSVRRRCWPGRRFSSAVTDTKALRVVQQG